MNAFDECRITGDSGVAMVVRWMKFRRRVYEGQIVRTDKGRCSQMLQRTVGDILFNSDEHTVGSIEVKTELSRRQNLFLETWSNAPVDQPERQKEGWMVTLRSDWLFYYFVDTDDLFVVRLPKLQLWAFSAARNDGTAGRIFDFPEKPQTKNRQLNVTMGRCVPIAVIEREVGLSTFNPARELQEGAAS